MYSQYSERGRVGEGALLDVRDAVAAQHPAGNNTLRSRHKAGNTQTISDTIQTASTAVQSKVTSQLYPLSHSGNNTHFENENEPHYANLKAINETLK